MKISNAWNRKIRSDKVVQKKYQHLFEMTTPYQASVLDGIELLTNGPLEPDFLKLLKLVGHQFYLRQKSPYSVSYCLGCVTLLLGSRYSTVPPYKIKINPSEGGLSLQQVINWARFATGSEFNLKVKRADYKVDLHNLHPVHCMKRIWATGFRTFNDQFTNQTFYLGGKRSSRTIVVYDKAKQSKITITTNTFWTRVEVREKYNKQKQVTLHDFLKSIHASSPFDDLIIVNADNKELESLIKRYGKNVIDDSVVATFKQLSTYQRNAVIKKLQVAGKLEFLSHQYKKQLDSWLKY